MQTRRIIAALAWKRDPDGLAGFIRQMDCLRALHRLKQKAPACNMAVRGGGKGSARNYALDLGGLETDLAFMKSNCQ